MEIPAVKKGSRVEIPVHSDLWMRGARYGTVDAVFSDGIARVFVDALNGYARFYVRELRRL